MKNNSLKYKLLNNVINIKSYYHFKTFFTKRHHINLKFRVHICFLQSVFENNFKFFLNIKFFFQNNFFHYEKALFSNNKIRSHKINVFPLNNMN